MKEKNPFEPQNPYIELEARFLMIEIALRDANANLERWRTDFQKIFIPDQTQFDDLRLEAKKAQAEKKSIAELDKIYLKMALIYKKWLPLKDRLHATNPVYKPLFVGLQKILDDIDKPSKAEIKDGLGQKPAKTTIHKERKKSTQRRRTKRDTV